MTEYGDFTSVKNSPNTLSEHFTRITVFATTRISVVFSAVTKVDSSGVNVVTKIVIYNSKSFIALQIAVSFSSLYSASSPALSSS
jgi:hypothetical protein